MKKAILLLSASLLGGIISIGIYKFFEPKWALPSHFDEVPRTFPTAYNPSANANTDFTEVSAKAVPAVVHVKSVTVESPNSLFDFFYGYGGGSQTNVGSGSGVIISEDGLIVTNNHVIENASSLEVIFNENESYKAEVIGTDPSTDIALLKIKTEKKLPFLVFGDSDALKVGEWVLAVGNPFNLTSTVTAGIVSAKSRDLNPYDGKNESFIQTDAAVNPGNSGGALINTHGHLIGINTAISSLTGSYVGYSFAVPSNIAKKIVEDLIEYGNVQKGILGVKGAELNSGLAKELKTNETEGFYVSSVEAGSGAQKSGIQQGDVIKKIDNIEIHKFSDLYGYISTKRPNDVVTVFILRNGKEKSIEIKLLKNETYYISQLGMGVRNLKPSEASKYKLSRGVVITDADRSFGEYDLEGKAIIQINETRINTVDDLRQAISTRNKYNRTLLILVNQRGEKERLVF